MKVSQEDILVSRMGRIGKLVLNRPKALNALTLAMCHAIEKALRAWTEDDRVEAVIIRQTGERAFCAGGDVRRLFAGGVDVQHRFWRDEYRLNALIRRYPKPYIAFVDGIVMGGGVGISLHGSHRIVTEKAVFAMPETAIGMIPDVGASHDLARMPGEIGLYLGMTGARLGTADSIYAGFGSHAVPRAGLDELERAIAEGGAAVIDATLIDNTFDAGRPSILACRTEIDRHFGHASPEQIFASLAADARDFARETLRTLQTKSPTSLKLAFRLIREARSRS